MQRQTELKGEMTGRAMKSHLINLYLNGVSKVSQIDDIQQLPRDIDEDPMIKDLMADIEILIVTTLRRWLSPILVACHTANHTEGFVTTKTTKQEELEEHG